MEREVAERPPRPPRPERIRSAATGAVASGVTVLLLQLVLGGTSGLALAGFVLLASGISFAIRYFANPRPYRNPWQ